VTRSVYRIVTGWKLFAHSSRLDRGYVLEKFLTLHRVHDSAMATILNDLKATVEFLPKQSYADEAKPIADVQLKASRSRKSETQ